MTTDMMPTDADTPADAPPPRRNSWVAVLVTVIGGLLIVALVVQAIIVGLTAGSGADRASYTADVADVTMVEIDISEALLATTFADVDEARLDVEATGWGASTDWTFEVDEGVLRVADDRWRAWWPDFAGIGRTEATLVLPSSLEGLIDADLHVSAGDLDVIGDLADVRIGVDAGSIAFDGASSDLDVDVSAGDAVIETAGPDTVSVQVSAGSVTAEIAGDAPTTTTVEVSAGDATLWLPDAAYAVTGEVSAGDRTIVVRTDPASPHALHVDVSAGSATIDYSG